MKPVALFTVCLGLLTACGTPKSTDSTVSTPALDSVITPAETPAPKVMDAYAEQLKGASIYEVNLRQYSEEGTFEAFAEHLPRLKELGVDVLWFMPIYPIGNDYRKGTLGSYYSVKNYREVNPEHGTMEDFKALVDQCHEMGFYVMLDWVANHTSWDNTLLKTHANWYTRDSSGNFQYPVRDWTDVADLDYEEDGLRAYMISSMQYWMLEANVDGFRCDVAEMVPNDFWMEAREALNEIGPNFMLAEGQDGELHPAFDMTYSWDFHHMMNDIYKGDRTAGDIEFFLEKEAKRLPEGAYRMHFITNHDENSWNGTVKERMGDGADAFAVLSVTMPGMPLVYSGQEAGLDKRLDFFEKDVIEWKKHPNTALYTSLLKMKEEVPAFAHGRFGANIEWIGTDNTNIAAFTRGDGEALVLINLSMEAQSGTLANGNANNSYSDWFSSKEVKIDNAKALNFAPWEYRVLIRK